MAATPDAQERNALIPLPTDTPQPVWQDAATTIVQLRADTKLPFPHCGAPSILDDASLLAHLFQAVDDGLSPTQAANTLGIGAQAITRWLQRAQEKPDDMALSLFSSALKSAQDRRRRRLLNTIGKAADHAPQHWTAAAWLLERGFGNDYKLAQDKTGGGVTIQIGIKAEDLKLAIASNSSIQVGIPAQSESTPLSLAPVDTLDIPVTR